LARAVDLATPKRVLPRRFDRTFLPVAELRIP
jgi:hypothetical protein